MLRELHISNLAVIEDATLDLSPGLNCFTGQTGAGKSLVLGAFSLLLGLKSGNAADLLRPGADEARVSGVFEIADADVAAEIAAVIDQPLDAGDELLLTRKLFASGRSSASVNGQPATAAMIRSIGELLVDIHGQHDHQYLLRPANQVFILDSFGGALDLRRSYDRLRSEVRDLTVRRAELAASSTLRRQQLDLYEFQADEIDSVQALEGEYEELRARHDLLSNLAEIQQNASHVVDALHESEGSIVDRLQAVVAVLRDMAELDESLGETAEQVRNAALSLQDGAYDLARYRDRLDLSPEELGEVEDRLNTLNRLVSKYGEPAAGTDPVAEVLAYREQIQGEIERLRSENTDLDTIDQQIETATAKLVEAGDALTQKRRAAAKKLRPLVEAQLKDLGMADAELHVAFGESDASDASPADGRGVPSDDDADHADLPVLPSVELMIRTNPGQPARPLRKIASGGEMSRIMLALKSIFAQSDRVSVLVFDEIDANIGGRMGTVIGTKLRRIAQGDGKGTHQVLCITHLPQIAAFADRHLRISKQVAGKGKSRTTTTQVSCIAGDERVTELAEMLAGGGATATTRKQVEEMLTAAAV